MSYLPKNESLSLFEIVELSNHFLKIKLNDEVLDAEIEFDKYIKAFTSESENSTKMSLAYFQDYFELINNIISSNKLKKKSKK